MSRGLGRTQTILLEAIGRCSSGRNTVHKVAMWRVLQEAYENDATVPAALNSRALLEYMNPSRVLASLAQRGLIKRWVSKSGGPPAVSITAEGRDYVARRTDNKGRSVKLKPRAPIAYRKFREIEETHGIEIGAMTKRSLARAIKLARLSKDESEAYIKTHLLHRFGRQYAKR